MSNRLFVSGKLNAGARLHKLGGVTDARGLVASSLGTEPPSEVLEPPPRAPLKWLSNRYFAHLRTGGRLYKVALEWDVVLEPALRLNGSVGVWLYTLSCAPDVEGAEAQVESASTNETDVALAWDFIEDRVDLWIEAAAKADREAAGAAMGPPGSTP